MLYSIRVCILGHSVVSYSLLPHGLSPARLLCSWDSPAKNTGMSSHSLFQGIFLTQELNLLHCRWTLYCLNLIRGNPYSSYNWNFVVFCQSLPIFLMSKPLGPFFYSLQQFWFFFWRGIKSSGFSLSSANRGDMILSSHLSRWFGCFLFIFLTYLLWLKLPVPCWIAMMRGGTLVLFLILGKKPSAFQLLSMVLAVLVINDLYYIPFIPKCWEFLSWKNVEFCQMLFLYLLINCMIFFFSFIFSLELEL